MLDIVPTEKLPPSLLWQRLSRLQIFQGFTDEQRDSFLHAYEHEAELRLRTFAPGEVICHQGEYELDLCFVLSGSVDLFNGPPNAGSTYVATLETGKFYGELGAIGGLPRTLDIVARERTEIFYLPRHALKYLEINLQARTLLASATARWQCASPWRSSNCSAGLRPSSSLS